MGHEVICLTVIFRGHQISIILLINGPVNVWTQEFELISIDYLFLTVGDVTPPLGKKLM